MAEPLLLRKDIPGVFLSSANGAAWSIGAPTATNRDGWEIVTINTQPQLEWNGYIDLSGYSKDDRTFLTTGGTVVRSGPINSTRVIVSTGAYVASNVLEWIFATQTPITSQLMFDAVDQHLHIPGFLGSTETPEQVILGEFAFWATVPTGQTVGTTDASRTALNQASTFGMGSPTASDRIYVSYRASLNPPVADQTHQILIPPMAVLLGGTSEQEPDLVYIDRLRRSYELQQTSDVD